MKQSAPAIVALACVLFSPACGETGKGGAGGGGEKPLAAAAESQPASRPAVDAKAKALLDRLERAGDKYATIKADIDYRVDQVKIGDIEERTGYVAYQKKTPKTPTKFRVHFDTLRQGDGPKLAEVVDYAFDGMWLTVKRHRIKNITRYQVAAKGETVEPLRIGKGPFPLPFGQKTADVVKYFKAFTRPAEGKDEPKDTDLLLLVPRDEHADEMNFVELKMWIDRKTNLPAKVVSTDKSRNITTVTFKKVETNKKLDDKEFSLPCPWGWKVRIEPLKKGARLTP